MLSHKRQLGIVQPREGHQLCELSLTLACTILSFKPVFFQDLCGLRLLVQCEVDGFAVEKSNAEAFAREYCGGAPKTDASDLADALSKMALKHSADAKTERNPAALVLVPYAGYETSHDTLIELKTRSTKNPHPLEAKDVYAQAIWSRTPTTINALPSHGEFEDVEIFKLDELESMESTKDIQKGVKRVGELLKATIRLVQDEPANSRFCLICKGPDTKELYLRKGGHGAGMTKNTFT